MSYIVSKYAYFFISSDGKFLAYCSRSNSFVKLSKALYEYLQNAKIDNCAVENIDEKLFNLLRKNRFLVQETEDYDFLLKHQFKEDQVTFHSSSLGLVLVPTLGCNFDCYYCFESGKKASRMSDEVINQLIEFIRKHKDIKELDITWYGGEPLLCFDIIQKIMSMIQSNLTIPLHGHSIVTNGYYFTQEVIDFFKENPLNMIQITLDGLKERHDSIRKQKKSGKGSFDTLISNMDNILKELPDTLLSVRVNIEKSNIQDYYDLESYLSNRWKGYNVNIHPGFLRIDDQSGKSLSCDAIDRWQAHEMLFDIRSQGKSKKSIYPVLSKGSGCCATVVNSYIIGPAGEIYKCWNDVSNEDRIIGYINQENLTNPSLYYRYVIGSKWYHNKECIDCFFLPICKGSCAYYRLRNQYEGGKYTLCQCLQKTPNMLNKCLEYWYNHR